VAVATIDYRAIDLCGDIICKNDIKNQLFDY